MEAVLKVAHFVALALFLGSIPGHILPGRLVDPALDLPGFALLMQAKYMILGVMGLAVFKPAWRRKKTNAVEVQP